MINLKQIIEEWKTELKQIKPESYPIAHNIINLLTQALEEASKVIRSDLSSDPEERGCGAYEWLKKWGCQ